MRITCCLAAFSLMVLGQQVSPRSLHLHTELTKREMTPQGFYGDTFSDGFGGFRTMRKRRMDIEVCRSRRYMISRVILCF